MTTTDLPKYLNLSSLTRRADAISDRLKELDERKLDVVREILHGADQLLILTPTCAEARVLVHFELLRAEARITRDWDELHRYVMMPPDGSDSQMRRDIALAREIDEARHA